MSALLPRPDGQVLSTLESDGSRRWLKPRVVVGQWWRRRVLVAWGLIAIFTLLPYLSLNGKPLFLLDVTHRRFTLFGYTFLPTDTLLLALLMVAIFVSIFLLTALFGRIWCGWACPQTVYMEFVYRPIERLLDGTVGRGGKPGKDLAAWRTAAKYAIYLVVSLYLAHTFLAWFVGVANLRLWMSHSPAQHPVAFLVMTATTGLMMFNFCFFREQLCIIACPYGRFQSVLLDRLSMIVSYDQRRGEPRGKLQKGPLTAGELKHGDCINCALCVAVCPTGIDIRQGLQMECVNCTQCMDACDSVMSKIGKASGLIRYGSQAGMAGEALSKWRPRVILYPLVLALVLGLLAFLLLRKEHTDLTLLRQSGLPFTQLAEDQIANPLRLKITNRTSLEKAYTVTLPGPIGTVMLPENPLRVAGDAVRIEALTVIAPRQAFVAGALWVTLQVSDGDQFQRELKFKLLGPHGPAPASPAPAVPSRPVEIPQP